MSKTAAAPPVSKSEESLTEELKIRLKPSQRQALGRVARKYGHEESRMARNAIVKRLVDEGEIPSHPAPAKPAPKRHARRQPKKGGQ